MKTRAIVAALALVLAALSLSACGAQPAAETPAPAPAQLLENGYYAAYDADDALVGYLKVAARTLTAYDADGSETGKYRYDYDEGDNIYYIDDEEAFTVEQQRRLLVLTTYEDGDEYMLEAVDKDDLPTPAAAPAETDTPAETAPPAETEKPAETEAPTAAPRPTPTPEPTEEPGGEFPEEWQQVRVVSNGEKTLYAILPPELAGALWVSDDGMESEAEYDPEDSSGFYFTAYAYTEAELQELLSAVDAFYEGDAAEPRERVFEYMCESLSDSVYDSYLELGGEPTSFTFESELFGVQWQAMDMYEYGDLGSMDMYMYMYMDDSSLFVVTAIALVMDDSANYYELYTMLMQDWIERVPQGYELQ